VYQPTPCIEKEIVQWVANLAQGQFSLKSTQELEDGGGKIQPKSADYTKANCSLVA